MTNNTNAIETIEATKLSNAGSQFLRTWDKIETTVFFKEEWNNGTGYLDGAVDDPISGMKSGDRFKTITENGRKVIGIVTPFGNVVIFQRYSDDPNVIVNNAPSKLRGLVLQTAMSCDSIQAVAGFFSFDKNIGKALQAAFDLGYAQRSKELENQSEAGPVTE